MQLQIRLGKLKSGEIRAWLGSALCFKAKNLGGFARDILLSEAGKNTAPPVRTPEKLPSSDH